MNIKKDFTVEVLYDVMPIGAIVSVCSDKYKVLKRQNKEQVTISVGVAYRNTGLKFIFMNGILIDAAITKGKERIDIEPKNALRMPICDLVDFLSHV